MYITDNILYLHVDDGNSYTVIPIRREDVVSISMFLGDDYAMLGEPWSFDVRITMSDGRKLNGRNRRHEYDAKTMSHELMKNWDEFLVLDSGWGDYEAIKFEGSTKEKGHYDSIHKGNCLSSPE